MNKFFIKIVTVLFMTILVVDFLCAQESQRMVVAHYMMGMPMYRDAGETTVADLKKDIIDAHDQGVDAFQIHTGPYNEGVPELMAKFYQAAYECDFPFYIFLSAGFGQSIPISRQWKDDDIIECIRLYANHPNQLRVEGRPLFNTWLGDQRGADFWGMVKQRLYEEHGVDIFYVPWYGIYFSYRGDQNRVISHDRMEQLLDEYEGVIDGLWYWGVDRSPFPSGTKTDIILSTGIPTENTRWDYQQWITKEGITPSTSIPSGAEIFSDVLKSHGMPFMTPVAPAFWATCKEPCKYTEFAGAKGIEAQWMSIINRQEARWVNLVTWNDMGEDSHWSPHPEPNRSASGGIVHSHAGYAELNKYYIKWWKSGRQPAIEQDKLFYFYRNQFHDAKPLEESCPQDCGYQIPDLVYVTTKLTAPAKLRIHSGSKTTVYDAPAGIHYWESDMGEGVQRFALVRDGKTIINATGEKTVDETPRYKSWSLFSGYAIGISE